MKFARQHNGETMGNLSKNKLMILALAGVALLFALGMGQDTALAQDHGHSHGQVENTHETEHVEQTGHEDAAHGEGHAEGHAEGDHGGGHSAVPHMANVIAFLAPVLPPVVAENLMAFVDPFFSFLIIIVLSLFFINLSKKLSARNPGRAQMAAEMIFGGLYGLFREIIGPSARRYTPFLGTLFVFILLNNLVGMMPLGHAATSSFATTTFALGIMTFLYVQFYALRLNGIGGYLHHMAGSPKTGMDWGFSLLLFPLHVLGELIKPISLALRLFGNIFGEDTLVATMVILGYIVTQLIAGDTGVVGYLPGVPLQLPFYFLGLLSSTIQALVFTLLATVYIALWLPHDDHAEGH
jgi:F-type H+-transporting ATPase subunit a